jgi:hypothetical protein
MGKSEQSQEVIEAETSLIEIGGVNIVEGSALASIMSGEMIKAEDAGDEGVPYLKMHHAIEQALEDHNFIHLYTKGEAEKLEEGYQISVLANIRMVRESVKDEAGQTRYKKAFETAASAEEFETLFKAHKADERDSRFKSGRVYLVALMIEGGRTIIAEFETCGLADSYWAFLPRAKFAQRKMVTISVGNHKVNIQKAKVGSNTYHSPKKFTQYKFGELDKTSLESIANLVNTNSELVNTWINKEPAGSW